MGGVVQRAATSLTVTAPQLLSKKPTMALHPQCDSYRQAIWVYQISYIACHLGIKPNHSLKDVLSIDMREGNK